MTLTPQQQHALAVPIQIGPLVLTLSDNTSRPSPLSAVYHTGQDKIIGVLRPGQIVVSHAEAVQQMETALGACGVTPEVSDFHLFKSESLLYVHYRLDIELDIGVEEPDLVIPEVILRNGYDGQIFCGLEYAVTQGLLSYRILIQGEPDIMNLQALLTASILEFTDVIVPQVQERLCDLKDQQASGEHVEAQYLVKYLSNKMLAEYYTALGETPGPVSAWQVLTILTGVIAHSSSYWHRRRIAGTLARQFGLTWHTQTMLSVTDFYTQRSYSLCPRHRHTTPSSISPMTTAPTTSPRPRSTAASWSSPWATLTSITPTAA